MVGCNLIRTAAEPRMDTKTEPRITLMTRIQKMPKTKLRRRKNDPPSLGYGVASEAKNAVACAVRSAYAR